MARVFFTMTCLNFILDEIKILRFLHLNVERWDAYALRGAIVALRGVDNACFVVCEVWDERDRKRRNFSLRNADGFRPPCDDILAALAEHPKFLEDR